MSTDLYGAFDCMFLSCHVRVSKGGYKEVSSTYTSIPYRLDTDSQIFLKVNNAATLVLPGKFIDSCHKCL